MCSRNGLTFIELTIVIFIIGLILAVAMPNFVGLLRSTKTGSTARSLVGYMKYVQDKAVRDNKEYIIIFDQYLSEYWTATELPEEEMPFEYYYASESERMRMRYPVYRDEFLGPVKLDPGITIPLIVDEEEYEHRKGYYKLFFHPDGTATRTAIYLQRDDDEVVSLLVKPYTGEVELFEGYVRMERLPDLEEEEE